MASFQTCLALVLGSALGQTTIAQPGHWTAPRPPTTSSIPAAEGTTIQQPEVVQLSPGHYVYAAPYSPAYWSPHLRPFPDYSQFQRGNLAGRRLNYRYGAFGAASYCGGTTAPAYGSWNGYGSCDVDAAYNQGRYDAQREYLWYIAAERAGRLINQHAEKFDAGVTAFRDGDYEQALQNLMGAAEYNHGSAAPRLHAGHAMFALGRYAPAVEMLARAFELAPSLPYKTYDLRDEYRNKSDFEAQLARLQRRVESHPGDAAAATLLAYVTYYTEGPRAAFPALRRARRLDRASYFIEKLHVVASAATSDSEDDDAAMEVKQPAKRQRPARTKSPILRVAQYQAAR